jgi:hypothetical protein
MPNGFWHASGPVNHREIKAASAFSKGDILTLDSSSSLSRLNPYAAVAASVYAIATADSTKSINGVCTVQEVLPGSRWWARTGTGVTLIRGEDSGVSFVVASGRYYVDESTTTKMVVVDHGTAEVDQSVESKAIVRFKYAAGELDLS